MKPPLDPKQTRSTRHWACYQLFYMAGDIDAHRHPWGALESPCGKIVWCYSRVHQEWIHPEQVWDRTFVPPAGTQNAMWHDATDILPLPKGHVVPVYAVQDGEVVWRWKGKSAGGSVAIEGTFRGARVIIIYQHLDPDTLPALHSQVKEGDQIAQLADLGDNAHLHCEVWSPEWLWLPDDPVGDPRNWCFKHNQNPPRGQYQLAAYQEMGINPHEWFTYAVMALVAIGGETA